MNTRARLHAMAAAAVVIGLIATTPGVATVVGGWVPHDPVPSADRGLDHPALDNSAGALPGRPQTSGIGPSSVLRPSVNCSANQRAWASTFGDLVPPLEVRHALQSPCYIGHDEPGMSFVANESYSGSRVQFVLQLPPGRTLTASAFSTFWVGMWLAGVPCSYRGQSFLEVQFNPPYSGVVSGPNPNWTVQAPVWDVVPAGSCDPTCQNDTATLTVQGRSYCEDDAVVSGVGTYTRTGWGGFAPGDLLQVQIVGGAGSLSPLSVFVNDSTSPSRSMNWSYPASATVAGHPLTPFYNSSAPTNGGWGYGLNVEAAWENCPESTGPTACNSYDGPAVAGVGVPTFRSATFWNSTSRTFSLPFAETATSSSSGACSGNLASVAPCFDFFTYGGTGTYPAWSIDASGGQAWWKFGGRDATQVSNYSGPVGEFSPNGTPVTFLAPSVMGPPTTSTSVTSGAVTIPVADPNGVAQVEFGDYWCNSGGTPVVATRLGALGGGPENTSFSGNWSASFPRNGLQSGTMPYWVRAMTSGGVWSPATFGTIGLAGGTPCAFTLPTRPWFGGANVTPVAGGFRLAWTENSTGIRNATVWLNSTVNGTPIAVPWLPSNNGTVSVPNASQAYRVAVAVTNYAGLSNRSAWTPATAPGPAIRAQLSGPAGGLFWVRQATVRFTTNVTGGAAPFSYAIDFGDGTNATIVTTNRSLSVVHNFGAYFGVAMTELTVLDADGRGATSNPVAIPIAATPLGVPQNVSAGDGWVNLAWSAPVSPAAPVTHYTVYFSTTRGSATSLTAFWPFNASAPYNVTVWNTTQTHLLRPIPDGETLYAQVLAWNSYGEGTLPAGVPAPVLVATPRPLNVTPISTLAGGPAPFTDALSAEVTGGTNLVVASAIYSFPGGAFVYPTINWTANGTWVNTTYTFTSPGLKTIVLHVTDTLFDTAIVTTTVSVGPGSGPAVNAAANPSPGWVGTPVTFTASATGGSGNFSYRWAFGDGTGGTGISASHAYNESGTFGAEVWVTDLGTGGTTLRNLTVTVYAPPTVSIESSAGPNGSLSYAFTAVASGGSGTLSFVWSFGDGAVAHGVTVLHDYGGAGTYTVNVVATDPTDHAAQSNISILAATGTGGAGSGGGLSGANLVPLILLAVVAFLFFLGTVYFWDKSRRPPIVMAPEPTSRAIVPGGVRDLDSGEPPRES